MILNTQTSTTNLETANRNSRSSSNYWIPSTIIQQLKVTSLRGLQEIGIYWKLTVASLLRWRIIHKLKLIMQFRLTWMPRGSKNKYLLHKLKTGRLWMLMYSNLSSITKALWTSLRKRLELFQSWATKKMLKKTLIHKSQCKLNTKLLFNHRWNPVWSRNMLRIRPKSSKTARDN